MATRQLKSKVKGVAARSKDLTPRFAGGCAGETFGNTAALAATTDLERISKGVYGLFDNTNPNYSVVQGDIMSSSGVRILEPMWANRDLIRIYQTSTILRQCVDSYVTNIESYGTALEYVGPTGQEHGRAAQNEKRRLQRLLDNLTTDGRPLKQHREDSRHDKEVLGARCFEVLVDTQGRVVGFDHIPVSTVQVTTIETEGVEVKVTDPVTGGVKWVRRRFRRFIQISGSGKRTWFKEWGDPRPISPDTGKVDTALSIEDEATAIYYDRLYSPGTPLGVPRWAGAIPTLLGSREAEMVNLNFFRDNAIPAMAVLVSGGALTEESFEKIDQYIAGVRGQAAMNRIVVLEASADAADAASVDGSLAAPKVDIKPMLSERQHEGLFSNYIADSSSKARSAFRLPPIYIGSASEYNRASAAASMLTADQQIFVPERSQWDLMFEHLVLSSHNIRLWRVRSQGPGLQDPQEVARIVTSLGAEGALTPNTAIKLANRHLDANIPPVMEAWGDLPFKLVLEAVNKGATVPGLDTLTQGLTKAANADDEDVYRHIEELGEQASGLRIALDGIVNALGTSLNDAETGLYSNTAE